MPKPKQQHQRFGDLPPVRDALERIGREGIKNATTKELILFLGAWLNDEITSVKDEILRPINRVTTAAWFIFGSIIAGIIAYIVISVVA